MNSTAMICPRTIRRIIGFRWHVVLLVGLLTFWGHAATTNNILFLIADDYGIDSMSLYNTNTAVTQPPTTNLNALAASGVLFRNAYAYPVCSPTRACLMTGRFGFRTGIGDVIGGGTPPLSSSEFTLPRAFAANPGLGYQVASFGKWHLANPNNSPLNVGGWTNFSGYMGGAPADYYNWTKVSNNVATANTNYITTEQVNDAISWIQSRNPNLPWFAWVAFTAPHTPFHKPPSSLLTASYASLPGTTMHINNNQRLYYEAAMQALDREIGRLISVVNRSNTTIIFIGDNGTPNQVLRAPYPSGRAKDTLYEGGTHVPMIIAGPQVANPGRTNDTLVNVVDLYPTILEIAGIDVAATVPATNAFDGRSVYATLLGDVTLSRYGYSEVFGPNVANASGGRALRNQQFKLIRFNDLTEQLYDVKNDPYEATNLLASALTAAASSNYYSLVLKLSDYQTNFSAPVITTLTNAAPQFTMTVQRQTGLNYSLWRAAELNDLAWAPVTNAVIVTNGSASVTLTDPGATNGTFFYRAMATAP